MAIRIVLAEDNYLVREGIKTVLEAQEDIEVVGVCADLGSLLDAATNYVPDVVLTDIRMPPAFKDEGISASLTLRGLHPEMGVVLLSQYDDPDYALTFLEKGAARRAYLLKERVGQADQIVSAIKEVASGGSVIDPKVVERLVDARTRAKESPIERLTPREREVLGEIAQGKNNAAIADGLFLTERAVEKHINAIFNKLELSEEPTVHRRVKAVLLFLASESAAATRSPEGPFSAPPGG